MTPLIPTERCRSPHGETAVDGTRSEAATPQPELEHRDVPADRADRELTLSEERSPPPSERTTRGRAELAVTGEPVRPLEPREGPSRERPADAVHRPGLETVRAKRDLQRSNAGAACKGLGRQSQGSHRQRNAYDGEATHDSPFATSSSPPSRREGRKPDGYNPPAAFPGSSIGRASGC